MRARIAAALIAAVAVLAGSFGVAAAGEHKAPVLLPGDCGCTGAARAKDRVERGLIKTPPASQSSQR